eukprot:CAMPEP_0177616832 /NCGR_PEP_ID=MMETSP0419_2-20121207/24440_1 /TAXON_ID=582737 /ORGANISM="Tetraselmis sp., Strain GSL018" /LENGTH=251 /DNA_ID=CAMNT_0019115065 /DNA_START=109 /DNA_END=864 /DNA_ORIENTATION=-
MAAVVSKSFASTVSRQVSVAPRGSKQVTRAAVEFYGPDRAKWLGPFSEGDVPPYLTGEFPGCEGVRIIGEAERVKRLARVEAVKILPERTAVNAVCLDRAHKKDLETKDGQNGLRVHKVRVAEIVQTTLGEYLSPPNLVHAQSILAILGFQVLLMGAVEAYRVNGGPLGEDLDRLYPGEAFDPLGLADDPDTFAELKVKEIKNGRLAMFSMFGFYVQAIVTGKGPIENLTDHLADPGAVNGFTQATKFVPQ